LQQCGIAIDIPVIKPRFRAFRDERGRTLNVRSVMLRRLCGFCSSSFSDATTA
jgi:hypothetical protein